MLAGKSRCSESHTRWGGERVLRRTARRESGCRGRSATDHAVDHVDHGRHDDDEPHSEDRSAAVTAIGLTQPTPEEGPVVVDLEPTGPNAPRTGPRSCGPEVELHAIRTEGSAIIPV